MDLIAATINEDAVATKSPLDMRNQRTYAVKVSYPQLQAYSVTKPDI